MNSIEILRELKHVLNSINMETKAETITITQDRNRMDRMLLEYIPIWKRLIIKHYKNKTGTSSLSKVRDSISLGTIDPEWRSELDAIETAFVFSQLRPEFSKIMSASGSYIARQISKSIDETYIFDITAPGSAALIQQWSEKMASYFGESMFASMNSIIEVSLKNGYPITAVQEFLDLGMNLTGKEARTLAKQLQMFLDQNMTMSEAMNRVKFLGDKMIKSRAARVAISEGNRSAFYGQIRSVVQAQELRFIINAKKKWIRTLFEESRNHASSIINDGAEVDVNDVFETGHYVPDEIGDHCYLEYIYQKNTMREFEPIARRPFADQVRNPIEDIF